MGLQTVSDAVPLYERIPSTICAWKVASHGRRQLVEKVRKNERKTLRECRSEDLRMPMCLMNTASQAAIALQKLDDR